MSGSSFDLPGDLKAGVDGGSVGPDAGAKVAAGALPSEPGGGARTMVRLLSGDFFGIEGRPVEVQVDVSARGSPGFNIVGLPGKSIRESRERIRAAISNSGLKFPYNHRVLVNLAPASAEKEGSGFDLAIALGILFATRQLKAAERWVSAAGLVEKIGFIGELGLNGDLRARVGANRASINARLQVAG